jgi:glutathione peroxidase
MNLYGLSVAALEGDLVDLGRYRGQVALVVNVASECGFTPQYSALEKLHEQFSGRGFTVLGFPSNEFGGQEPGSPQEIRQFCTSRYKVTFPLFAKSKTRPGPDQSPVYKALGEQSGKHPSWNFAKYLVGRDGELRAFFEPKVAPDNAALVEAIETALTAPG